jgi:hypothetical protein
VFNVNNAALTIQTRVIVDRVASYVAKHGHQFEKLLMDREARNSTYDIHNNPSSLVRPLPQIDCLVVDVHVLVMISYLMIKHLIICTIDGVLIHYHKVIVQPIGERHHFKW